jgi:transformation/transcription domain-associated protein
LTRLKKVFEEPSKVSSTTISNFLEIFIHLLDEMEESKILLIIKSLQPGLAICITSAQTKVLRLMSTFLSKLFSLFPPEVYMKHDELRFLYQTVEKAIRNGLEVFEKDTETPTASFFGTFLILKTAFSNDTKYFEKFVEKFTRFVVLLKTDHLKVISQTTPQTPSPNTELTKEMLTQSLHLLKNYLNIMSTDTRKTYINTIIIDLIENSSDTKIMKAIIQLLENWFNMKNPASEPCMREKILLLQKLTYHIENRFGSDVQLNIQFLELIFFIFTNSDALELTSKLDRAFLAGLKCSQFEIRQKFFEFFNKTVDKSVYTRLLYILSTRTWDHLGHHYWIKQCIELLFLTVDSQNVQGMTGSESKLPKIALSQQLSELFSPVDIDDDVKDNAEHEKLDDITQIANSYNSIQSRDVLIKRLVASQGKLSTLSRQFNTESFLKSVVQVCHVDGKLSEKLWIKMFPQLWSNFEYSERKSLTKEIIPFLSTGTKVNINGANMSALNTFVQALAVCDPPVFISPRLMKSISKVHNVWHTITLLTEDMTESYMREMVETDEFELEENTDDSASEVFSSLSSLYSSLKEEDLWAGLWKMHAKYPDTNAAIFFEQMGYFDEAQSTYESVMLKFKQEVSNGMNTSGITTEIDLWEEHWIKCTRELNEWTSLMNYASTNRDKYIMLLIDCAWKLSDWNLMCQSFIRAEQLISKQSNYKLGLYGGFISLLCQKETVIAKYIEVASTASLQEWRHLPNIISNVHIPVLQIAQQIMELQEAGQIHQDLLRKQALPFHDMKSIIKTWRNRLPIISDDLSHWKDIFAWRQHHYKLIVDNATGSNVIVANLGSQASAQTYIKLAKVARKHNLTSLCQKSLTDIDSISSIPLSDCFQKIVQQVKNLMAIAEYSSDPKANFTDALKIVENVNLELFQAESKAVLCAYKGYLHSYIGNSLEANKAFTTAVDLCDSSSKAWALYGEYLENIFKKASKTSISSGVSAITCYLHASRDHNEMKARKHLAKVLWLLTYDEARAEMLKVLDNYMFGIPMINWLSWIPQLFNILVQYEGDTVMNLLNQIAKIFPQAVYFPIRTLYLMLKIEQRERYKNIEHLKSFGEQPGTSMNQSNLLSMKSTAAMWRCSKIMQLVREIHPTIVCSLENILDQLMSKSDIDGTRWFRENIFEENLHQLKQGLAKCYGIAFENRLTINEATTTQHTLNFIRKLISNFSVMSENASDSLLQDPVFVKLRQQFADGFSFTQPENNKLIDLIKRLKICIRIMEEKVKYLSK